MAVAVAAGDQVDMMELAFVFEDTPILERLLIYNLPVPTWLFFFFAGIIAWLLHDGHGLSWWGAIWRSLVMFVVSFILGYGAALIVRENAQYIFTDAGTAEFASVIVGLLVFLIAMGWLIQVFPSATAGERSQPKGQTRIGPELAAAEVVPTVSQLTAATVVNRKRIPLASLFRRLVGVVAGLAFLSVALLAVWIGWIQVVGTSKLGVQEIIVVVLVGTIIGGLLFWIARWGSEL